MVRIGTDEHVLQRRHVVEQPDVLEGPRNPELCHHKALLAVDPAAVEMHLPFTRVEQARHHIEHRGLAGTIRADQCEDLTLVNGELEGVYCN